MAKNNDSQTKVTDAFDQLERKPTYKSACKAMCAQCVGCHQGYQEPGWKQMIRECRSLDCPLHDFRPFKD